MCVLWVNKCIVIFVLIPFCLGENYVIVSTHSGDVRGKQMTDENGGLFYGFQSIPYAKAPIGTLRFRAPQPVEPWEDVLNATVVAPRCPQFKYGELVGQEDCLFLNIYTPQLVSDREDLAVMVYIHGGAYYEGTGSYEVYGPEFLMPENIVLVTLNYRLGRFGSLNFEDQTLGVPGNAHLKDQVMALKWINKNIKLFGGDAKRITLFGESVGGASVHLHMLSPMSKGLFHRVIAQSGTAVNVWNQGIVGTGKMVAEKLGISAKSEREIIQELQKTPMEKIMETQTKDGLAVAVHVKHEYSPVIEKQTNEPAFLQDLPINIINSGDFSKVPIILGYNSNDTIICQVISRLYTGSAASMPSLSELIPHDLNLRNDQEKTEVANKIKEKYFRKEEDLRSVRRFLEVTLGPWFIASVNQVVKKMVDKSSSEMYFYVFSGDTKLNFFKRLHPVTANYKGASHMDELGHLFKTAYTPQVLAGSPEDKTRKNLIKLWTNFAKFGNPTPDNKPPEVKWLPVTKKTFNYLDIGETLKNGVNPNEETFKFWDDIYKKYN